MRTHLIVAAGVFLTSALVGDGAAQLSFSDQTANAGLNVLHSSSGVLDPFGGDFPFPEMVGGVGVGDFDNNGYMDIFFCSGGLRRDRLLMANGDGTFTNKAGEYGVAGGHQGSGCAVGDFDKDGWMDIFVQSHGPTFAPAPGHHKLFHNEGGTHFTEVAVQAGVSTTSTILSDGFGSCFGDYDLDGDLDLCALGWRTVPFPSLGNRLFRNNGDGTFTDVSQAAGIEIPDMNGFSPTFVDMDGDLYPELLAVSDFTTARYFKNNGDGSFTDFTAQAGTGLECCGMGNAYGDLNDDGIFDWVVSSIYALSEGNPLRDGNKVYLGLGNNVFTEVAADVKLDDGGWGWGTVIADIDHDMDLDILETNGWRDPNNYFVSENAYVWINLDPPNMRFSSKAVDLGFISANQGRGLTPVDYDRDGDLDFVMSNNQGPLTLMRNDLGHTAQTSWAIIQLDTASSPQLASRGFGTHITIQAGGKTQRRYIDGGCHYMTTNPWEAHVGLGAATQIDSLELRWTDGSVETYTNLPVNQYHRFTAGAAP